MQRSGSLADLKTDCREFRWERPCAPHKREGVTCPDCPHYDPVLAGKTSAEHTVELGGAGTGGGGVLVVKLAAAGDVLRTTALLPAIRKRYPGARVTWLTHPDAQEVFMGNGLVDEVWTTSKPGDFDVVLCPDADPETAALAAAACGKARQGFTMDQRGNVVPLNAAAEHWLRMGISDPLKKANTETYQSLVAKALDLDPAAAGRPILQPAAADVDWAAAFVAGHGLARPIVGINTGASPRWRHKRWTREHQAEFITTMTNKGVCVLLLGGHEEAEAHRELCRNRDPRLVVSAGTALSYGRFAAVIECCQALVTGDTLALHVATAREVPAVVLFGPTSAAEIELYGQGRKIQPEALSCLVCYLPDCDVKPHCQELISAEQVAVAVEELLS